MMKRRKLVPGHFNTNQNKARTRVGQFGLIHRCEITARLLRFHPGYDDIYVTRGDVRNGFKRGHARVFLFSAERYFYSRQGWCLDCPTAATFRVGCCTFGPAATKTLRKWARQ
jgi:hypothetical protein